MTKWDDFKQVWAAEFKNLTDKDGVDCWEQFVNASDLQVVKEAVTLLSDQYYTKKENDPYAKMPSLPLLRRMYWTLKDKTKIFTDGKCPYCHINDMNSGTLEIVVREEGEKQVMMNPNNPERAVGLSTAVAPCVCGDGRVPMKYREECVSKSFGPGCVSSEAAREFIGECEVMNMEREEVE